MPARNLESAPRAYVSRGEWPTGTLRRGAPFEAHKLAAISQRLKAAIGERSLRSIAAESDVSIGTLSNILGGRTWGDLVTLARLERALGADLWSGGAHTSAKSATSAANDKTGRNDAKTGRSDLKPALRGSR